VYEVLRTVPVIDVSSVLGNHYCIHIQRVNEAISSDLSRFDLQLWMAGMILLSVLLA
jgi:hypothetical protein